MPLWVKKGSMKFPEEDTPAIMVGPGTGVAPFRSAIQERMAQGKSCEILLFFYFSGFFPNFIIIIIISQCNIVQPFSFSCHLANVLFFGCRSESKDFYFSSEWEDMKKAGHVTLFTAFSQDQVRNTLHHSLVLHGHTVYRPVLALGGTR